jgi:hypothetical protein
MDEGGANSNTRLLLHEDSGGDLERKSERPKEPWRGEYVKSIVYGGLDAIITCFSLISSISASSNSSGIYMLFSPPFKTYNYSNFFFKLSTSFSKKKLIS